MFDKISGFITDTLIEGKVIKSEEKNLYLYCFGTIIEMSANLLATLIIGALLHRFIETLIFMLVFIPLRSFAGGYHCEKAESCFILSISVYLSVMLSYKYFCGISEYWVCAVCLGVRTGVYISNMHNYNMQVSYTNGYNDTVISAGRPDLIKSYPEKPRW